MNQYNRMICYLYHYENGQKMENVGFARIEEKGERSRIFIRIKLLEEEKLPDAYLFWNQNGEMAGIKIGVLKVHNGGLECKCQWRTKKLKEEECSFSEMDGLAICYGTKMKYITTWHDIYVDTTQFKVVSIEEKKKSQAERKETNSFNSSEEKQKERKVSGEDISKKRQEKKEIADKMQDLRESMEKQYEKIDSDMAEKEKKEEPEMEAESFCDHCPVKRKSSDYGEKILAVFPSMAPFHTQEVRQCVRLELQDIGCFPVRAWSLANNAFVLRGYYCYRHLLFAKTRDYGYVFGVPGIYTEKDKELAGKYGFTLFQQIGTESSLAGAFGYYMMPMEKFVTNEVRQKC